MSRLTASGYDYSSNEFRRAEKERAGLAHHALLHVKIGKFFERANFFRGQLGDAFVYGDGLGEETVADKNLREAFEIIDGLEVRPGGCRARRRSSSVTSSRGSNSFRICWYSAIAWATLPWFNSFCAASTNLLLL